MSPKELKQLRLNYGLTQREMALKLCVSLSTFRNWERGRVLIPEICVNYIKHCFKG